MRALVVIPLLVACTNNEPQYVDCPTNAAASAVPNDVCSLTGGMDDGMGGILPALGSLHVPVKPDTLWKADDRQRRMELQRTVDMTSPGIVVPVYRLEHYDLSVEWVVHNLEAVDSTFKINLNGANEDAAYDPSMIMVADERSPKPPPLLGNIPIDIPAMGTVSGVFREDQLREAAIDLDQITRGNINMFRATLTVNKNDDFFQPVTPVMIDPATGDPIGGEPDGPKVPKDAWRQMTRIDIDFRPSRMMSIEYSLRIREKVDVIHEEGLNATPTSELNIIDPPYYQAVLP